MSDVTLVLTSCGRFDLLDKTIQSISPSIISSLSNKIIIDDSGREDAKTYFSKYGDDWNIIINDENIGQPRSVDKAYSQVDSEYIFHCEDDWLFDPSFSLQDCVDILNYESNSLQVTFRKDCPHPVDPQVRSTPKGVDYQLKVPGWNSEWYGFTYNPSVFRKSAYDSLGKYQGFREQDISRFYYDKGFFTYALTKKYVEHIGWGRGTQSHKKL
jgi:hypothetical protein